MEIGLFQLENILRGPSPFLFFDLRPRGHVTPPEVANLLMRAQKRGLPEILTFLKAERINSSQPIVLICQDGHTSEAAAQKLEAAGFDQVYRVERGVVGLLSELEPD